MLKRNMNYYVIYVISVVNWEFIVNVFLFLYLEGLFMKNEKIISNIEVIMIEEIL